jgi:predicted RNA binding protein YcfA (HicA-like mRNA interferase family)
MRFRGRSDVSKLRPLSGDDLVKIFGLFGFMQVAGTRHRKLRRETPSGRQTLVIPMHRSLDRGTLHAIYRQALRYIPEAELAPYFYTE